MGLVWFSYVGCAIAFLALALFVFANRDQARGTGLASLAMALTGLWAAISAVQIMADTERWRGLVELTLVTSAIETVRSVAWLAFLAALVRAGGPGRVVTRLLVWGTYIAVVAAAFIVINDAALLVGMPANWPAGIPLLTFIVRLSFAIAGLALIENVLRNVDSKCLWSVKFLCIGLAAIFIYDLIVYSDALLFVQLDWNMLSARGAIALLTVPLLYLASLRGADRFSSIAISRRFTVHTVSVFGAGVYLLLMGSAGWYIRSFGGAWGAVTQSTFIAAALILLVMVIFSGTFRSYIKVYVAKHFFPYKYDYRDEWLRFIHTLEMADGPIDLQDRVIHAIANITDSPGGGLWERDEVAQAFVPTANWNIGKQNSVEPAEGDFAHFLGNRHWVIDIIDAKGNSDAYPGLGLPEWIDTMRHAWLVVPLIHAEQLHGFLILQRARAPRQLDWEDHDLLKTVGRQAASYLAAWKAQRQLTDAGELQMFSKRFAFIVHDVKTLISQLSLLLSNADKHHDSPEFRHDLIATVRESVDTMNRLLSQINAERRKGTAAGAADLVSIVYRTLAGHANGASHVSFECADPAILVHGDEGRVAAVARHLIQNAIDAAGETGRVVVRLRRDGVAAELEVADNGPGMTLEFARDELFRPFRSTKNTGYGIGAYQCRELVRELGGRLVVNTAPKHGTTIRVRLPLITGNEVEPIRMVL